MSPKHLVTICFWSVYAVGSEDLENILLRIPYARRDFKIWFSMLRFLYLNLNTLLYNYLVSNSILMLDVFMWCDPYFQPPAFDRFPRIMTRKPYFWKQVCMSVCRREISETVTPISLKFGLGYFYKNSHSIHNLFSKIFMH